MAESRSGRVAVGGSGRLAALRARLRPPEGGFARGVAALAGGSAVGQGLALLAAPALTRLYQPADYGVLAAYAAVLAILLVVASWRYQLAIPLPEDDRTAAHVAVLAAAAVGAMALVAAGLVAVAGAPLAWALGMPALAPYLWLMPLTLLGAGLFQAVHYWTLRRQQFGAIARTRLTQAGGQIGVQLGLGLAGLGPLGLVLGDLVGRAAGTAGLARAAWREDRALFAATTWGDMRAAAARFKKFPLLTTPAALLNACGLQAPALALAAMFGPAVVGCYALGQRVFGVPFELVGDAVGKVFYARAAREAQADPAALARSFGRTSLALAGIGAAPALALALSGPWLCATAFGPAWREAGVYLAILAPAFLAKFVASPTAVLLILERQDLALLRELVRAAIVGAALALAWAYALGPRAAVGLLSAGSTLGYGIYFGLSCLAIAQHRARAGASGRVAA